MQHARLQPESGTDALDHAAHQPDLRHQNQALAALLDDLPGGVQIDLGFAAAGHAVDEGGVKAGAAIADPLQRLGLRGGQRRRRSGGGRLFAAAVGHLPDQAQARQALQAAAVKAADLSQVSIGAWFLQQRIDRGLLPSAELGAGLGRGRFAGMPPPRWRPLGGRTRTESYGHRQRVHLADGRRKVAGGPLDQFAIEWFEQRGRVKSRFQAAQAAFVPVVVRSRHDADQAAPPKRNLHARADGGWVQIAGIVIKALI